MTAEITVTLLSRLKQYQISNTPLHSGEKQHGKFKFCPLGAKRCGMAENLMPRQRCSKG